MVFPTAELRKAGGPITSAVPPALLDVLRMLPGAKVGLAVERSRLVVEPQPRSRYTPDELLANPAPCPCPRRPKAVSVLVRYTPR